VDYELLADNALHFPKLLESPEDYISFCRTEASSLGIDVEPWLSGGDVTPHIYGDMWILRRSVKSDTVQRLMDNYEEIVKDVMSLKTERGSKYRTEPRTLVPIEVLEGQVYLKAVRGYEKKTPLKADTPGSE
jgi:hypothetical protein